MTWLGEVLVAAATLFYILAIVLLALLPVILITLGIFGLVKYLSG